MEYKVLNNGLKMPMVGLGVYNISERETQRVVEDAISVGYRSIDTAAMYYNEKGVGDAVRACGVPREELLITTKICDSCYSREDTLRFLQCFIDSPLTEKELNCYINSYKDGTSAWFNYNQGFPFKTRAFSRDYNISRASACCKV